MRRALELMKACLSLLFFCVPAHADVVAGAPPVGRDVTTFVVLPDTQNYSQYFPGTYEAQIRWILRERDRRNIAAVFHLGDVTNTNAPAEWEVARRSMQMLDGRVPYFMVTGNHDYDPLGHSTSRDTPFIEYFPVLKMSKEATFGGAYDKEPLRSDNTFHLFEAGGRKWLVLALEFGPRRDVVRWANEVVLKHPTRSVILITHAYLYSDGTRYDWNRKGMDQLWNPHFYGVSKLEGGSMDGEELWEGLVSKHDNFALTINGHVLNSA